MKRFTIELYDTDELFEELKDARKCSRDKNVSAVLVHVYSAVTDTGMLQLLLNEIAEELPGSIIVGYTSSSEIMDGRITDPAIIISVSVFYKTEIICREYNFKRGEEHETGKKVCADIDSTPGVKGIEIMGNCHKFTVMPLFEEINKCDPNIKIFGAAPYAHERDQPFFIFSGRDVREPALITLCFIGEDFHIMADRAVGWKPLGIEMKITRSDAIKVYEIDHRPAFYVYNKYLQIQNDQNFFINTYEFPLLMYTNETYVLKMPSACDENGYFTMFASIPEGESVFLSYGDPDTIMQEIHECSARLKKFQPEAIMLYSCAIRRIFWKHRVNNEMRPFQEVADSAGFFTGGEILRMNGQLFYMNATLVVIGIREGDIEEDAESHNIAVRHADTNEHISLQHRLALFINVAMEELRQANERLHRTAVTDELTQLYNRREMNSRISQCQEESDIFSLVMLDIDNFKKVNDTYGHDIGDIVLKDVSVMIRECIEDKPDAIAGRWGGEEFMILLPSTVVNAAAETAERLRQAVENHPFEAAGPLTISIGVVDSNHCSKMNVLYRDVDAALYEAKRTGKNRVVITFRKDDTVTETYAASVGKYIGGSR